MANVFFNDLKGLEHIWPQMSLQLAVQLVMPKIFAIFHSHNGHNVKISVFFKIKFD